MLVNLNDVLKDAREKKYGVGLFNTTDTDMLEGVIAAAEELRSPVIVGTAEILLPFGELKLIAPAIIKAAERATVPVVVHYDHGLTFDRCMEALDLGFTSVMYDCSTDSYEDNIKRVKEMADIAHSRGATIEGELGHVGDNEGSMEGDSQLDDPSKFYTDPQSAKDFVEKTGVDALAIAIGTAHGAYKSTPKLDIERLKQISGTIDTPLVLHGGSGLSDDDFRNTIKYGISKVNIFTDLCLAGKAAMKENLEKDYLDIRNAKVEAFKAATIRKMKLFGSDGRY